MDSNGYNPSVLQDKQECWICGHQGELVRHEVFHGAYRQKSKKLGTWVLLCTRCHYEVHFGSVSADKHLKRKAEKILLGQGWTEEKFRDVFGKSYLEIW